MIEYRFGRDLIEVPNQGWWQPGGIVPWKEKKKGFKLRCWTVSYNRGAKGMTTVMEMMEVDRHRQ
jgi:hypothetical protein